jgi:hypothetical protein
MNNFGFGADPFGKTSGQVLSQQSAIAKAQLPADPDKTPAGEVEGGLGGIAGVMKAQKGARDVLGAVRKGQAQVRQGVSAVRGAMQSGGQDGADNLMDHLRANPPDSSFQNANQLGEGARATQAPARPAGGLDETGLDDDAPSTVLPTTGGEQAGSIARPTPTRPSTGPGSQIPDGDGTRGIGLVGDEDNLRLGMSPLADIAARDMFATASDTGAVGSLMPLGLPKMNVANTINRTVGGGAGSTEDPVSSGLSNLHAQVQGMGDKIASVGSKVDAGLDTGIGAAEGVLDAMGPIGDILGAVAGIFGAVKAHKDKVEEEQHNEQEKSDIATATQGGTTNNTLATNVGRMTNTPTGNTIQQSVQSHF